MLDNPRAARVKAVAQLSQRKARSETGLFLLEGPQAVAEALAYRPELVVELYATPTALERYADIAATAVDAGVDVIKLIDQDEMTFEEAKAVVDEAHKYGKPVVGHSHRPDEIRVGLKIGIDCFEHTGLSSAPEYPADGCRVPAGRRGVPGHLA
jgi:hypothetical protein